MRQWRMNGHAAKYVGLSIVTALFILTLVFSPELAAASSSFDPHEQIGHQHHHGSSSSGEGIISSLSLEEWLFHIVRAFYYMALLFAAGLMLWSLAEQAKPSIQDKPLSDRLSKLRLNGQRVLLITVLLHVFLSYRMLMQGFDSSTSEMLRIFTDTRMGHSWLALLALSLLGFLILKSDAVIKMLWALLLLAAESYNGHVLALDAFTTAIVFDFIHLVGAALWAGGLLLLVLLWFKDRDAAVRFAPKFSSLAWLSIVALSISGIIMTVLLIPSWTYLLYTSWGVMLLIKTALVIVVTVTGYSLRRLIRNGKLPSGSLLKLDGILMAAIVVIVSVFTYLSPEPHTEPLNYHHMGEELHYTLILTPNGPGPNEAVVKVWLPEELGDPADVKLSLKAADRPRKAPIEVELSAFQAEQSFEFPGFTESNYRSSEITLPFPGPWTAELVIVDSSGMESVHTVQFRND